MNSKEEAEGEGTSRAPSRRLDASEGDEDEEESMAGTVLHVSLHTPQFHSTKKVNLLEMWRTFSAVAWCGKSNLIALATEICAKDPSSDSHNAFWIPVHIVHPERPTEHTVFNVIADSPCDLIQFLEWSPVSCPRALLVGTSSGRVTVWMQPTHGGSNVAHAMNCWSCEHEWRQDQASTTKWLTGVSPYRWTPTTASLLLKSPFEDRFISHQPRASVRWPNFLCICSVSISGSVQLHWCQWPPLQQSGTSQKWFSTNKGVLGAGPSGLISSDAIVSETGALLVAGVPIGNPSTVVVWEVSPWCMNNQGTGQQVLFKSGMATLSPSLSFNPAFCPGIAPLPGYLLSWHEGLRLDVKGSQEGSENALSPPNVEGKTHNLTPDAGTQKPQVFVDDGEAPSLQCSPVSNLSAYVMPETCQSSTGLGSGVGAIAFDPSKGGSVMAVLIMEGNCFSPNYPDEGPTLSGYRLQRWESSRQQVVIHPLFEPTGAGYTGSSHPTTIMWKSTAEKSIPVIKGCTGGETTFSECGGNNTESYKIVDVDRPTSVKPYSKVIFSAHGAEVAVAIAGGDVHVCCGSNLTSVDNYYVRVGMLSAAPSFSPAGCCLSTVWHDSKRDCSALKIIRVNPPAVPGMQANTSSGTNWERGLADRFWWSLVSEVDWWDSIGCTQSAVEEGLVTFHKVIAVLDADFHSLPGLKDRQHYGPALDRIKCRMLEGADGSDVRAVVLDMQARLLLDMLGKGIEASLLNPATFISEPWMASSETLTQLVQDAMAVEPAVVQYIQSYVDAVLDLASHFLTRLRRYASFCRTLATHAAGSTPASVANTRLPSSTSSTAGLAPATSQTSQPASGSSNGATSVQAWVQGAIAKVNNSTEGAASLTSSVVAGTVTPLQLSVSQAAFPGMPAVRLIGDCNFLHRLCQLLLFCLIFRRRPPQRYTATPPRNLDGMDGSDELGGGRPPRTGSGNAGQGYTSDEVKFLFLVTLNLCKKTSSLSHPMPKSQVGLSSPSVRLHYPDGQYSVAPEVVEASLGQHIQNLPRPRGADSAGLLMRELELHPPGEDWSKRNLFGGPWAGALELHQPLDEKKSFGASCWPWSAIVENSSEDLPTVRDLWPRKRRYAERDTAFGLKTGAGMGSFLGFMGSRRDTITTAWKNAAQGVWHKCIRCGRQTGALSTPSTNASTSSSVDAWWTGRWAYACPMCAGSWIRIV